MGEGQGCCQGESEGESKKQCCGGGKNKFVAAVLILIGLAGIAFALCKSGICPTKPSATASQPVK